MWRRPYSTGDKEATTRYGYVIERRSKGVTGYELTYLSVTQQSPPHEVGNSGLDPTSWSHIGALLSQTPRDKNLNLAGQWLDPTLPLSLHQVRESAIN